MSIYIEVKRGTFGLLYILHDWIADHEIVRPIRADEYSAFLAQGVPVIRA